MSVGVLGSINLDNVCRVARIPLAGETVVGRSLERFAGGKGANQAVAAAAWGGSSRLIGAVGRDEAGDFLVERLSAAGVDTAAVVALAGASSGQAQICVADNGENMIVVIGGANLALAPEHVAAADLADATVFLAQLETPTTAARTLFERAAAQGGRTILNAAPALEAGRALFPLADILVVNQGELALYAGAEAAPASAQASIPLARRLIGPPGQTVIVTLGAAGALAVTAEDQIEVAGQAARVVDTTGAGDCFCGVLAAALAEGLGLAEAMRWANAAAAISTEQAGAFAPANLRAVTEGRLNSSTA
jgi:ribokinase